MELLGSSLTVSQALPKERGTFQRGSVERFSVELEPGRELGDVLAIKVWSLVIKGFLNRRFHMGINRSVHTNLHWILSSSPYVTNLLAVACELP